MASEFLAVLPAIEISTGENDVIKLDEGGVVANATIAAGTYFLRGDGSADDILLAIKTALDAAFVGGNAYGVTLTTDGSTPSVNTDKASPTAIVRVARTAGATTFRVRWLAASGSTFDASFLGFAVEKAAADALAELSTLSPLGVWVANDRHADLIPDIEVQRAEVELANGSMDAIDRSDPAHTRRVLYQLIDGRRLFAHRISADPNRAWQRVWQKLVDGRRCELHELDLQSSTSFLLGAMSTSTRAQNDGITSWKLAGDSARSIRATRVRTGMDTWDLEVLFRGYVAP